MESGCKCLKSVNYLQCIKILLRVSVYENAVYRQFYDRISLSQFSIFQWYYKNVASLCLEENVCSKNGKRLFFYLLQLRMLLVNAPAQLWEELKSSLYNDTESTESLHDVKRAQGSIGRTESHRNTKWVLQEQWSETEQILKFSQEQIPQHLVVKMSVATQTF